MGVDVRVAILYEEALSYFVEQSHSTRPEQIHPSLGIVFFKVYGVCSLPLLLHPSHGCHHPLHRRWLLAAHYFMNSGTLPLC